MEYLPIVAIAISVIGLLFQQFGVIVRINERLARLETKVELFWKSIEGNIIQLLKTYPTNVSMDVLLDKMLHNELNIADAQELRMILKEEMKTAQSNKLAYILALGRLEQIIFELKPRRDR